MFDNKQTEASGGFPEIPFPAYNNNASQSSFHRNMTAGRDQMLALGSNGRPAAAASSSSSFSGFRDLIQQCGGPLAQFPGYDHPCPRGHMLGGHMASASADLSSPGFNAPPDARLPHHQHYLQQILLNGPASFEAANACKMTAQEIVEAKALAASKSHSEAERRRRERINTHLATLRSLLPSTTKTDKASLLAEVIEHVKELKRHAADLAQGSPVPSECDELSVDTSCNEEGRLLIKASLCCDDRPDLLSDLIKTLRTLRLRAVKAEIATLGGRVKNVFVVTNGCPSSSDTADQHHHHHHNHHPDAPEESSGRDFQENPSVTCIQEALKAVMERQNSGEFSPAGTSNTAANKRQRLGQFGASLRILDDPPF